MPNPNSTPVASKRSRPERLASMMIKAASTPMTATPTGSTANHKSPATPELKMEKEVRSLLAGRYKSGSAQAQTIRIAPTTATTAAGSLSPARPEPDRSTGTGTGATHSGGVGADPGPTVR